MNWGNDRGRDMRNPICLGIFRITTYYRSKVMWFLHPWDGRYTQSVTFFGITWILNIMRVLQTICTISIQPDFLYIWVRLLKYCAWGDISISEITIVLYSMLLLPGSSSVPRILAFKDLARSFRSLSFDERFRKNLALKYSNSCSFVPK